MLHLNKYIKVFFTKEDSDEEIVNWIRDNIISKRKADSKKSFFETIDQTYVLLYIQSRSQKKFTLKSYGSTTIFIILFQDNIISKRKKFQRKDFLRW